MHFFLATHCGGGPSPLHPPTRFYFILSFFDRLPLLPTLIPFCRFILSAMISIEPCAYQLLPWYALRGRRCAVPPAPPHPLSFFNRLPLLPPPIPMDFSISINYLGSYVLLTWPALPVFTFNRFHLLATPTLCFFTCIVSWDSSDLY